jgi:hypothetical protein
MIVACAIFSLVVAGMTYDSRDSGELNVCVYGKLNDLQVVYDYQCLCGKKISAESPMPDNVMELHCKCGRLCPVVIVQNEPFYKDVDDANE